LGSTMISWKSRKSKLLTGLFDLEMEATMILCDN
jgi:hypothetical protein